MALNLNKIKHESTGPKQDPIEEGSYPCRVVQVIDLGVQAQQPFKGEEKPPKHEVSITYEFLDEFCVGEDGEEMEDKPRWLSETFPVYSLEAERAKSTQRYLAIDPAQEFGGDLLSLVGKTCMVTVVHNPGKGKNAGKVYTNVGSVSTMRPKEAAKAPELVNEPKTFDLDDPSLEVFTSFPEWLQDKIKGNLEYNGSKLQELLGGEVEIKPEADEEDESTDTGATSDEW